MAKKSSVEKNNHRKELVKRFAEKRKALLAIANDESREMEERFERASSSPSCRATRRPPASATAAR